MKGMWLRLLSHLQMLPWKMLPPQVSAQLVCLLALFDHRTASRLQCLASLGNVPTPWASACRGNPLLPPRQGYKAHNLAHNTCHTRLWFAGHVLHADTGHGEPTPMDAEPSPAGKAAAAADKAKPGQAEFDIVRKKRTKLVSVPFQAATPGGIASQALQVVAVPLPSQARSEFSFDWHIFGSRVSGSAQSPETGPL